MVGGGKKRNYRARQFEPDGFMVVLFNLDILLTAKVSRTEIGRKGKSEMIFRAMTAMKG